MNVITIIVVSVLPLLPRAYITVSVDSFDPIKDDPGVPLILTPFIEQNKIQDALRASQVYFNGFKGVKSYSGYLTVNKQFNANLFFWFFPSQTDYTKSPVILWLQGGPGSSSLEGLFIEHGPFKVMSQHGLDLRKYTWISNHSVIYIDNPVGTGYSFTDQGGYCRNQTEIGVHLHNFLQQFFLLFPELQQNDFFVCGESFAGKYVPAIAYTIHKNREGAKVKINLKGISIGNGFSDPENQLNYSDYLYQIGLIDDITRMEMEQKQKEILSLIENRNWTEAFQKFDQFILGDLINTTYLQNMTGFNIYSNFLNNEEISYEKQYLLKYLDRNDVRAAIHVGNATFQSPAKTVEINLESDIMQSVSVWVSELLNSYKVLIYNGQLDLIVPYSNTVNYLKKLNFTASENYKTSKRYKWYVDGELAGYWKEGGNLREVLVRDAGHMVPMDQPKWALDLISKFARNQPLLAKSYL